MPNWRELLSETLRIERDDVLRDLAQSDIDELILVATGGESAERELAFGLLCILESRQDLRLMEQPRQAWHSPEDEWKRLEGEAKRNPRDRPPQCQGDKELYDVIATEVVLRLPLADGGELALGPGRVDCSVRVSIEANPLATSDASDFVHLEARVTDAAGEAYAASRRWLVDRLVLPLVSRDESVGPERNVEPFAQGLRCFADHRHRYPALGWVAGAFTFSYWAKRLYLTIDLLLRRGILFPNGERTPDMVIAKIHPSLNGAIGYRPTPVVRAGIPHLARMVYCPGLLAGNYPAEAVVLAHCGTGDNPQPNVRVVRGGP
jgi:hypothetical protein